MERLRLYPLSVILSYCSEVDGTCLLITNKRYASQVLPLFRLKDEPATGLRVVNQPMTKQAKRKYRHRYVVSPVQDALILLARLNTRRIFKRKRPKVHGLATDAMALREWHDALTARHFPFPPSLELLRFRHASSEFQPHGVTLLASYPRSGNSLVRSLLERTTGLVTGSDTRPDRNLSRELAEQHGLVGEGVTKAVAICKTHWPERTGCAVFEVNRVILLVRNPYDAIDSYWNMNATMSHTKTVTDEVYERFQTKFEALVRNEIHVWMKFHQYWLDQQATNVLIVRYADLIRQPAQQLERMLQFCLSVDTLSQFWKERIAHVTGDTIEQLGNYRPRDSVSRDRTTSSSAVTSAIGKSLRRNRYSDTLIQHIHNVAESYPRNYLREFGYDHVQDGFPDNLTGSLLQPQLQRSHSLTPGTVQVNVGSPVRPVDCEFGRAMRAWRLSITDNDRQPLPTISR